MDWNTLPDLLALSALVAVFFSLLPRNAGRNVRLWLTAWILILIHFVAHFSDHSGTNDTASLVSLAALDLAGLTFMMAAASKRAMRADALVFAALAVPQLAYIAVSIYAPKAPVSVYDWLVVVGLIVPVAAIATRIRSRRERMHATVACAILAISLFVLFHFDADPTDGVNNLLTWVYFYAAILHWRRADRATAGTVTTIGGFLVWSSVFPISAAIAIWAPHLHIDGTAYNIPKYVVAIGIILMLLEEQMERSMFLAFHDDLTGLPNRRLFDERARSAIERAKRNGRKIALLTVDLDHFKMINDTFGHGVGDQLLRGVAARFTSRMRAIDTCARFGGDEFVIIADQLSTRDDAKRFANDLIATLDEPIEFGATRIHANASVGIAVYPDDGADFETLYAISDSQMYNAKHSRRRLELLDGEKLATG